MTWKTIASAAAAAVIAAAPLAASAHEGQGLKLGAFLGTHDSMGLHLGQVVGLHVGEDASTTASTTKVERDNEDRGGRHATSTAIVASTTAARISAQASRILRVADTMSAFGGTLSSRIASSSLSTTTAASANALLSDFNTNVAQAKVQANAALSLSTQLGSTTASSTTSLAAQARTDLKSAREFLRAAAQDMRHILSLIFKA